MKKILKGNIIRRKAVTDCARNDEVKERMLFASSHDESKVLEKFGTTECGLNAALIEKSRRNRFSKEYALLLSTLSQQFYLYLHLFRFSPI